MTMRTLLRALVLTALAALIVIPAASAHVTMNPGEWEEGGFARFALRVPNESDTASTTKIVVQFPENVISARFEPVPGWKRTIKMAQLDEPIESEEGPITERLDTVTWEGGEIKPGEFMEFGVSLRVPEDAAGQTLWFPAIQTYSDGEEAEWIEQDPEAEEPAPSVAVLAAATGEEAPASDTTATDTTSADEAAVGEAAAATDDGEDDDGLATLALVLSIVALLMGGGALAYALTRSRRTAG
jgi:uncharacterized protein YcnI